MERSGERSKREIEASLLSTLNCTRSVVYCTLRDMRAEPPASASGDQESLDSSLLPTIYELQGHGHLRGTVPWYSFDSAKSLDAASARARPCTS